MVEKMIRLIDAIALMKKICRNECNSVCDTECENVLCNFYDYIMDAPTIEAEPVIHAHWVVDTWCSNCSRFPVDASEPISNQKLTKLFSRCPHCGAKMDESLNA